MIFWLQTVDAGLKIIGMHMRAADDNLVLDHYDDLEPRIGKEAFAAVCRYVQSGVVVAIALEGGVCSGCSSLSSVCIRSRYKRPPLLVP